MFSSLDRADIELKAGPDGRRQFVQTDHRTAVEIAQEPELSIVFALIRIFNPKRFTEAGSTEPIIFYSAQELPPEFLRQTIHAAGGRLLVGDQEQPVPQGTETPKLEDVISSAFANMAQAVATEFQVSLTPEGLQKVELALADAAGDPDEDEFTYWSSVVKLGCFCGELIRTSAGGQWRVTDSGTLPFALFTHIGNGESKINPLGKAIKFFENGNEDSLVFLYQVIIAEIAKAQNPALAESEPLPVAKKKTSFSVILVLVAILAFGGGAYYVIDKAKSKSAAQDSANPIPLSHPATTNLAADITPKLADISIQSARFGTGKRKADVTDKVIELLQNDSNEFAVNPKVLGADPLPGKKKQLVVKYAYQGSNCVLWLSEGKHLSRQILINNLSK
jgi:hypothetical protein